MVLTTTTKHTEVKMKANELRIGNYLLNDVVFQVNPITLTMIIDKTWEFFQPIPLTEEWLLKFGFVAKSIDYNFTLGNIEIASAIRVLSTNERRNFYLDCDIPEWMKIQIEYVHQLQNLYFALTGEELTIGGQGE